MNASKQAIVAGIRDAQREAKRVVESVPESAWMTGVYENGWNAKQILCHVALISYVPSLLVGLASQPEGSSRSPGATSNIDDFNEQQVAVRVDKPPAEVLAEIDRNYDQAVSLIERTSDELLAKQIRTPWGTEGTLGEKILVEDLREHVMAHLADISAATH